MAWWRPPELMSVSARNGVRAECCVRAGSPPVAVGWPRLAYIARLQRPRIFTLPLLLCSEHVAVAPMGNEGQPCTVRRDDCAYGPSWHGGDF